MTSRKRKITYVLIVGISFLFLVPIVPMTVLRSSVLPDNCDWHNSRPIVASLSYAAYGRILLSYIVYGRVWERMDWGNFGLIYVPDNGWFTIQFPPLGMMESHACMG